MSEESLFLYHLTLTPAYHDPSHWTDKDRQTIGAHAAFFDELGKQGHLIFAGRTQFDPGHENLFGIALIKAESLAAAEAMMADDPAVVHGIQQSQVFPFAVAIDHFANIIKDQ
ncbi:MAG: YciI family protein [Chloroflexota bacterium]